MSSSKAKPSPTSSASASKQKPTPANDSPLASKKVQKRDEVNQELESSGSVEEVTDLLDNTHLPFTPSLPEIPTPRQSASSVTTDESSKKHEEIKEEKTIREAAEDLDYSQALKEGYISNSVNPPKDDSCLGTYSASHQAFQEEEYVYCLVNSITYKEGMDFRAFIQSVFYVGKGTGPRLFKHPFEVLENVDKRSYCRDIWQQGGKVTAVCLGKYSNRTAEEIEALIMTAFGEKHFNSKKCNIGQLWNYRLEKNKVPKLPGGQTPDSVGAYLLYTASETYAKKDKAVIFEVMFL